MSIRVKYSEDPAIARLQRKRDQESEMMCLALIDGDKTDAEQHRVRMEQYKDQIRKLNAAK